MAELRAGQDAPPTVFKASRGGEMPPLRFLLHDFLTSLLGFFPFVWYPSLSVSPYCMSQPFRVAAIVTTFFPNSHAGVIVPKFLRGFPTDDGLVAPRTQLASLYH